jgi:hypothetical protein
MEIYKVNERRHLEQSCLHSTYIRYFQKLSIFCTERDMAEHSKDDWLKYPQISLDIQGVN